MSTVKLARVEPVCIGPTWQRDPDHPSGFAHPARSLGPGAVAWAWKWLRHEDGSRWVCTDEQERFLAWWYAIDDQGRFVYRDGVLQRLKGWGKDPLAAVIAAIEFLGPCRYGPSAEMAADRWNVPQPTGRRQSQAWVQIAATAKDQTRTTMRIFPWLFSREAVDEYGIDVGKEIIYAEHGRRVIECVTSSPNALEGMRSTFVIRNETHHWLSNNGGHEMNAVINRNNAKSKKGASRALSITNAYEPGEESVAQMAREAWEKVAAGQAVDTGMLYDSLEAPPDAKLTAEDAPAVVEAVRGDADWLDVPRIIQEILDIRNPPSQSRRFYYNQIVATEDAWVTPQEWDALAEVSKVDDGELIALGFDGSLTDDHCALVGARISDGYRFPLGVWDPADHGGEAPREAIDGAVRQAFEKYDVVAFFSDLHPWESYVDAWDRDLGRERGRELCAAASPKHRVAWDMRTRVKEFTLEGTERLHNEIVEGKVHHDGDRKVRQHVVNARRRPNQWGVGFGKEHRESSRKVDALSAMILAGLARRAYLALPKTRQRRRQQRAVFF
jgi:hypothetical protein